MIFPCFMTILFSHLCHEAMDLSAVWVIVVVRKLCTMTSDHFQPTKRPVHCTICLGVCSLLSISQSTILSKITQEKSQFVLSSPNSIPASFFDFMKTVVFKLRPCHRKEMKAYIKLIFSFIWQHLLFFQLQYLSLRSSPQVSLKLEANAPDAGTEAGGA